MSEQLTMPEWIRELRRRTGWTQAQLAERTGLKTQTVSLLEIGRRCPSGPVILLMRQTSDLIGMAPPPSCKSAWKGADD